jgi:hypothetical protein
MIDSFIPTELAVAPNPLGLISSLQLRTIPVDAYTCFELWAPANDRLLIREEAMLLKDDFSRLEEICSHLTWLFGATLFQGATAHSQELVYNWRHLVDSMHGLGASFDAMIVEYGPAVICSNHTENGAVTGWTISPATWKILFLELKLAERGYASTVVPLSVSISYGQSKTKLVEVAGAAAMAMVSLK